MPDAITFAIVSFVFIKGSLRYVSADSAYELGEMNNTIVKSLFDPALGYNQSSSFANTGRLQRMQQSTSYDPLMKTNETIGVQIQYYFKIHSFHQWQFCKKIG